MATSEAQKRATIKYHREKLKRIPLCVKKEIYPIWKQAADEAGESLNGFIKEAVRARIELGW